MLIWSKLQLDRWLETSLGRLNLELRGSLSAMPGCSEPSDALPPGGAGDSRGGGDGNAAAAQNDRLQQDLLERVEGAVSRLSGFVVEHQDSFKRVWSAECRLMLKAATVFLWMACVLAIGITAGMFWLFLQNNMEGEHRSASTHFAVCTLCGLIAPALYVLVAGGLSCNAPEDPPLPAEAFEDCIEAPPSLESPRGGQGATGAERGILWRLGLPQFSPGAAGAGGGGGERRGSVQLRALGRRLVQAARWPGARAAALQPPLGDGLREGLTCGGADGGGGAGEALRESLRGLDPGGAGVAGGGHGGGYLDTGWARMDDEGGLCMTELRRPGERRASRGDAGGPGGLGGPGGRPPGADLEQG